MDILDGILLGALQGLTEFLPVSSSGHLGMGRALFGINIENSMALDLALHGATVLSTIVVFRKYIWRLILSLFSPKTNKEDFNFVLKILISAIPILIVGVTLEEAISEHLTDNMFVIGGSLMLTAVLLWLTTKIKPKKEHELSWKDAFIVGIAQSIAVLPGLSRSGSTIATGLMLGVKRTEMATFSFLMVLVPIIGGNILQVIKYSQESALSQSATTTTSNTIPIMAGAITAFIVGVLACKWMINLVKKGNLNYFAIYCAIVAIIVIATKLIK